MNSGTCPSPGIRCLVLFWFYARAENLRVNNFALPSLT